MNLGDFAPSSPVSFKFPTVVWGTGVPSTLSAATAKVYKDGGSSSTTGVVLTTDFDSTTGLNHIAIDLSADLAFYADGSDYQVVVSGTVAAASVLLCPATFSIRNRETVLADAAHGGLSATMALGHGLLLAGGASGHGVTAMGGSVEGYAVYLSHTSTPDGSDVFGQLGPNVLDLVHLVAPTGPATEFVEAMTQLYYREFPPGPGGETFKSTSDHTVRTRDASGNVITTQPYTDDNAGNESLGPPS